MTPRPHTNSLRTTAARSGNGRYLRLTGKRHAEDGDAAENALPASVTNSPQPLPAEEAVLEGRQHNLQPEKEKGLRSNPEQLCGWDKRRRVVALRGFAAYHSLTSDSRTRQLPTPPARFPKSPSNLQAPLATEEPGLYFKRYMTCPPHLIPSDITAHPRVEQFPPTHLTARITVPSDFFCTLLNTYLNPNGK